MPRSSLERIQKHLKNRGAHSAVPEDLQGDLRSVVRRCESLRSLGEVYDSIELSPYMKSLMRVSSFDASARRPVAQPTDTPVAASI